MVRYMKCIKTGCDVICDERIYHGDLFYHDGIFILSGVPKEYLESVNCDVNYLKSENKPIFFHFKCKEMFEIPSTAYGCYLIKRVFDIQDYFANQIKSYETDECFKDLFKA